MTNRPISLFFGTVVVSPGHELAVTYLLFSALISLSSGANAIFSHNLFFLISILLSGLAMYYLAYEFSKDKLSSLFAGSVYCSSGYVMSEFLWGHATKLQIQWIPAIFLFLERTLFNPNLKNSIIL